MSVLRPARTEGGHHQLWRVARRSLPLLIAAEAVLVAGAAVPGSSLTPPRDPDLATLRQEMEPSVVDTITFAEPAGTQILGTGIVVSSTGLVLTDYHVIRGNIYIGVRVGGLGDVHQAVVVTSDAADDLALLQIEGGPAGKPAQLAAASIVKVGEPVVAIGNAMGLDIEPGAAAGHLVALNRPVSYGVGGEVVTLARAMEAATPIFTGDSGGPLVDGGGRVIGMIAAGSDDNPCAPAATCPLHVTYAVPIHQALAQIHFRPGPEQSG